MMPKIHHLPHDKDGTEVELPTVSGEARFTTGQKLIYWTGALFLGFVVAFSSSLIRSNASTNLSLGTGLQPLAPQGEKGCGSVILLSPGRSATNSLSNTVVASSTLKFCHPGFIPTNLNWNQGIKEFFKITLPERHRMQKCIDQKGSKGWYLHVKPEHIQGRDTKGKRQVLNTPDDFFAAARDVGFVAVVLNFRDNQLARQMSSFEMSHGVGERFGPGTLEFLPDAHKSFVETNMISVFEEQAQLYNNAVLGAKRSGLHIEHLTFYNVTHNICRAAHVVAQVCAHCPQFKCTEDVRNFKAAAHKRTLDERVGPSAAASIITQLTGTPYEWMLDLSASSWPSDVPRHIPILS